MAARDSTPGAAVRELGDELPFEVRYWRGATGGAAPSAGRWVALARCQSRMDAATVADALARLHG